MNFDTLFEKFAKRYSLINEVGEMSAMGGDPNAMEGPASPGPAGEPVPGSQPAPVPVEPEPLPPEGKVYLIKVARKALFVDPNDIPEALRRELAETEVTQENAEQFEKKIIDAIGGDVEASEEPPPHAIPAI